MLKMPPIFKNADVQFNNLSPETKLQVKSNYKSKKLVGSFFGKRMLFHTDLLKWYLEKGLVVSNVSYAVEYKRKAPFTAFVEQVSNDRRAGDKDKAYKLRGEMMKLMGNSSYGKCITNFLKHETVKIVDDISYTKNIRRNNYIGHQDLHDWIRVSFQEDVIQAEFTSSNWLCCVSISQIENVTVLL